MGGAARVAGMGGRGGLIYAVPNGRIQRSGLTGSNGYKKGWGGARGSRAVVGPGGFPGRASAGPPCRGCGPGPIRPSCRASPWHDAGRAGSC
jgi:hypothetical protein